MLLAQLSTIKITWLSPFPEVPIHDTGHSYAIYLVNYHHSHIFCKPVNSPTESQGEIYLFIFYSSNSLCDSLTKCLIEV